MNFPKKTLHDLDEPTGSVALTRVDFNVPLDAQRRVEDTTRLEAVQETILHLLENGYRPVLMSHLGRPDGKVDPGLKMDPIVEPLSELLDAAVRKADDCVGDEARSLVEDLSQGEVGLLENLRFHEGEEASNSDFSRRLSEVADFYVNDAFGASHREHASITGVPEYVNTAVSGFLLEKEYEILTELREAPDHPFVVLMGGAKISDKFPLIKQFLQQADEVLVAGAMANTFMLAKGGSVGDSLVDREMVPEAKELLENHDSYPGNLHVVSDVVAMKSADPSASTKVFKSDSISEGWKAMDIGPETIDEFRSVLENSKLVFWNGPPGVFEEERFASGTRELVKILDSISAKVVIGGGDSSAAVNQMGFNDSFYHVSTGGGASMLLLESGTLPGIDALDSREPVSTK